MSSVKRVSSRKLRKCLDEKSSDLKSSEFNYNEKKIKKHKVKLTMSKIEEKKLDQMIANDDGLLVAIIIIVLSLCFFAGILLGCVLYRIAINGGL